MDTRTDSPVTVDIETRHGLMAAQPFTAGLNSDACARLAETASCHSLARGQFLFRQHEPATHFFLVVAGSLKLYRIAPTGAEKIVGRVGPEESFAEGVLFMDRPQYPVHAQAETTSEVLGLSRAVYRDILAASPETCLAVMGQLTGRIRRLLDEIESLTLQSSRDRVIRFLRDQLASQARDNMTVTLPAPKITIAAQLSIRPETLSRILGGLVDDKLIERTPDPAIFRIPSPRALHNPTPGAPHGR